MSYASPRSWAPALRDLSLPRWAFVAWLVHQRQRVAGPPAAIALAADNDIDAIRCARLLRELVPQDL